MSAELPRDLARRFDLVRFELLSCFPQPPLHRMLLSALVWAHVDHTNQDKLTALAELFDRYVDECRPSRTEVRVSRMPRYLSLRMYGCILHLEFAGRGASVKTVASALVWDHVFPSAEDPDRFDTLVRTLVAYAEADASSGTGVSAR